MRLGPIEFVTPPLVEGPKIIFSIPIPEELSTKIPFVMKTADGYGLPITSTVTSTWFIMVVLFIILFINSKRMKVIPGYLQTVIEAIYTFLDDLITQMLGKWKVVFQGYLTTLALFIFFANILSFFPIPWFEVKDGVVNIYPPFRSPTADLNTTVGLALMTFVIFTVTSFYCNGVKGYFKSFLSPIAALLPLNIIGLVAKPTNISVRLFGNMFAGGVILGLLYKAVPWGIPAPLHLYFDLFSGVVQSFVFLMLTIVYIQESLGDTDYDEKVMKKSKIKN
ncbi:MAG: F0F1 ATP synthase subunit A [Fusobacteriaceae bacterium]